MVRYRRQAERVRTYHEDVTQARVPDIMSHGANHDGEDILRPQQAM